MSRAFSAITLVAASVALGSLPVRADAVAVSPLPTPLQTMAAESVDGLVYVFGGWSSTPIYDTVHGATYAYDPGTDAWSSRAPMPTPRHWSTATAVDGVIYVFGGETRGIATPGWTHPTAVVEAYHPDTDTWTTCAPMPTPRWGACSAYVDGKIYVIGGSNAYADYSVVEAYDPLTNTWSTHAPMPTARRTQACGVVDGAIYVAGGATGPTVLATVERYVPATNAWSAAAALPAPGHNFAMVRYGDLLYAIAGFDTVGNSLTSSVAYDAATNAWLAGPSLLVGRGTHRAVVAAGTIYVLGGSSPPNATIASVEALVPDAPPVDVTPPSLSVSGLPGLLWPPNHRMVELAPVVRVEDDADPSPSVTVTVTSSESDDGLGDGDTAGDAQVLSPDDILLRAERSGRGPGRIYTLTWTATDAAGNTATVSHEVRVPRSHRR